MSISRLLVCLVLTAGAWELKALAELAEPKLPSLQQPHQHNESAAERPIPYSYKKLEKMMQKAILNIILGELHPADMLLLKEFNYSLEEVMAIRQREFARAKEEAQKPEEEAQKPEEEAQKPEEDEEVLQRKPASSADSLEAYNRQAVYDYENDPAVTESERPDEYEDGERDSIRRSFDRGMEPHVIFKVRYDDSELDSSSEEQPRGLPQAKSLDGDSFQAPGSDDGQAAGPLAASAAPGLVDEEEAVSRAKNLVAGWVEVGGDVYRVVAEGTDK